MILSLFSVQAVAASVTLTNSDGYGSSSFNSAGNWDNGAAPSGGNDYFTGNYRLRTPAANGSFTFAGNSLTVNNDVGVTDGDLYGFSYKGGDCDITIDNLILDGGSINHINGGGDIFNLYGNLSIVSESVIRAKQGPINIYSAISGSSQITVLDSDTADCKLWFLSSNNTFTGDIVNNGRFGLADDANLNFVIGASGVNNSVSDGGSQRHATFDGDFIFDLTGAGTTLGDNWAVITTTAASTYYGSTFSVLGFTDMGDDTWMGLANGIAYLFDETTGVLFVVSEPASITSDLSNTAVNEAETAVFTTVFTSASTPVVTWYKVADPSIQHLIRPNPVLMCKPYTMPSRATILQRCQSAIQRWKTRDIITARFRMPLSIPRAANRPPWKFTAFWHIGRWTRPAISAAAIRKRSAAITLQLTAPRHLFPVQTESLTVPFKSTQPMDGLYLGC